MMAPFVDGDVGWRTTRRGGAYEVLARLSCVIICGIEGPACRAAFEAFGRRPLSVLAPSGQVLRSHPNVGCANGEDSAMATREVTTNSRGGASRGALVHAT